jgi:CO dehydrogenase/acetyl-CoA synthase beta subunit
MSWEFKCAKEFVTLYIWWRVFISKIGPAYDFRFIYISSLLRLFFNRERIVLLANQVAHKLVWCRAINSTSHIEIEEEEVDVLYTCNGCHLLSLTFICVDKYNKNIIIGDKKQCIYIYKNI